MEPVEALERIAQLLERMREPTYRVRAFRNAADAIRSLDRAALEAQAAAPGGLRALSGVGEKTERVIVQALNGQTPSYLTRLEGDLPESETGPAADLRAALKGDCHTHSDWSDGGSPIEVMASTAQQLGHEYLVLTDHPPRLTIANGLSRERLLEQLEVVSEVNDRLAPFRVLTGIEVDILEDGSLDQDPDVLERLDVVVASVHSKLRMDAEGMTRRMVAALGSPYVDIIGHCTGRIVVGRGRPESQFDAAAVFAAAAEKGKAVEVNCRPERLDPPRRLLRQAIEAGCLLAIDTDAHAPGQLEWQPFGCERVAECGAGPDVVVNAMDVDGLLSWAAAHEQ